MNKQEIINQLQSNHQAFIDYIKSLSDEDFLFTKNDEKWSAGEHAEHIKRSIAPLKLAYRLPKWLLKLLFGKANRASKTYDELVEKYKKKLTEGAKASGAYIPGKVNFAQKEVLLDNIRKSINLLSQLLNRFQDTDLDSYILPHPVLGKLTLREMMYFTIYHVAHHHKLVVDYLEKHL